MITLTAIQEAHKTATEEPTEANLLRLRRVLLMEAGRVEREAEAQKGVRAGNAKDWSLTSFGSKG